MEEGKSPLIVGFYGARHKKLEPCDLLQKIAATENNTAGDPVFGVAWYYNPREPSSALFHSGITFSSMLLVFRQSGTYAYNVTYFGNNFWLRATEPILLPYIGYAQQPWTTAYPLVGGNVRTVQYRDELIIVQDNGLIPVRFVMDVNGNPRLFRLGIQPPTTAPALISQAAGGLNGTYQYRYTWVDEKGRESSPSPSSAVINPANQQNTIRVWFPRNSPDNTTVTGFPDDILNNPQVIRLGDATTAKIYLYRTLNGGTVYYRCATVTLDPGTLTQDGQGLHTDIVDNMSDSTLNAQVAAPLPGDNDPPRRASYACIHKQRLFLNDRSLWDTPTAVQSVNWLQVSNSDAPTQFSSVADLDRPSMGTTLTVGSDPGDPVMCMASYGSLLGIWKQRSYHLLTGDAVADFSGFYQWSVKPVHQKGCIAPDTLRRCNDWLLFLAEDGLYRLSYGDGFSLQPVSLDVENLFTGYAAGAVFQSVG